MGLKWTIQTLLILFFFIEVFPQIIEPPINQSVTEGNSVSFSCRATGVPTPTLVWVFKRLSLLFPPGQFCVKNNLA